MFRHAIVRPPTSNFADGLTEAGLGVPDHRKALDQHGAYRLALVKCGVSVIGLDPWPDYPDATFVEDTAVVFDKTAVVMQPGAPSRRAEVIGMIGPLKDFFSCLHFIQPPGLIDGGDVLIAENRIFVGLSNRTNSEGARQLMAYASERLKGQTIDIGSHEKILHLKSGVAYLGENRLLVLDSLKGRPELEGFELVTVPEGEEYAANCIRVNDFVIIPSGYPNTRELLARLGYRTIEVDVSEYRKMDGGLSCLSIRF